MDLVESRIWNRQYACMGHKSMELFELTIFDDKSLHHVYRIKEWVTSRNMLSIQKF